MGERSEDEAGASYPQSDCIELPRTMESTATPLVRNLEKGWMEAVIASEEKKKRRMEDAPVY